MKLVLFDIDGTLIYHVGRHINVGWPRFIYSIEKTWGVKVLPDESKNYNGQTDRQIMWDLVSAAGISRNAFIQKFAESAIALEEFELKRVSGGVKLYQLIPEAVSLVRNLSGLPGYHLALLTGNVKNMAAWKLSHAGIDDSYFEFGFYGDDADDRISLAASVLSRVNTELQSNISSEDITVIGDTIPDVQCARAIGAHCIITLTGGHTTKEEIIKLNPDLVVDTLADISVYNYFHIRPQA